MTESTHSTPTHLKLELSRAMWNMLRRTEYRGSGRKTVDENTFQKLLRLECKRANRSQRRFVLMLLESGSQGVLSDSAMNTIMRTLPGSTRETDIVGWYEDGSIIGVIFTEIGASDAKAIRSRLFSKITQMLENTVGNGQADQIRLSFQLFPTSTAVETSPGVRYLDSAWSPRYQEGQLNNETLALKATNSSL